MPKRDRAERFLDRIDKRSVRRIRLRKVRSSLYLNAEMWDLIDRNRIPMGMSRSTFIAYCIYTTTRKYEQARAVQLERANDTEGIRRDHQERNTGPM